MYSADRRYQFFWMALESLFGSNGASEVGSKLAQRISFFLAETPQDAKELFRKVKACYKMRSTIIHGRWKDDPKIDDVMADTEAIVRTAFRHLLENPKLLETFISRDRDSYLEEFVFSNANSFRSRSVGA
jgi:Apea-like HEPN